MRTPRIIAVLLAVTGATFALAACGSEDGLSTPSDPVLARGQTVYRQNCASCHGSTGGGGAGPKLAGNMTTRYPDIDDQIAVIADGRSGMPAFGERLPAEDIEAVARYEREVL